MDQKHIEEKTLDLEISAALLIGKIKKFPSNHLDPRQKNAWNRVKSEVESALRLSEKIEAQQHAKR